MLNSHLNELLSGGAAHISFESALAGFPFGMAGRRAETIEHSMWMLVEHLRLVNQDLIDWVVAEEYQEKSYPAGYWPQNPNPASPEAWQASINAVGNGIETMKQWIERGDPDITAPLVRRSEHSASREILLTIAHNGYHIGQMVDLRALLGVPVKDW